MPVLSLLSILAMFLPVIFEYIPYHIGWCGLKQFLLDHLSIMEEARHIRGQVTEMTNSVLSLKMRPCDAYQAVGNV